jgi:iron complex outermembrane receptor protein
VLNTRFAFCFVLLSLLSSLAIAQVTGVVLHERDDPLPNATVLLLPDSIYQITDVDGRYRFSKLKQGEYQIQSSYVAHESQTTTFSFSGKPLELNFSLQYDTDRLGEVIIEGEHGHSEEVLRNIHLEEGFVEMETKGSLAQTLDRQAGIASINVGVGVSKPVIRGLSSNRIIVLTDNVKQEGQQWGADHGLEVDQYDVEEIEILKGPASLQYGSDGLGGVLNILPEKIPEKGKLKAVVLGNFRSNNLHGGGSARIALNLNNVFGSIRYSHQEFGDYQVPDDSFVYNGFELPITDKILKNTAGRERNISGFAGILRIWGLTRLDVSHYWLDVGLFSGAVGIPRSYALTDDGNNRDIDQPNQSVRHLKAVLSQELFLPNHQILHLHFGYQENIRREFSFPEFHSAAVVDPNNTLAVELRLRTFTLNGHFDQEVKSNLTNTYGFDVQYQTNTRDGFEVFIPDFQTVRSGIYTISNWQATEKILLQGGLRVDYGKNVTEYSERYVYAVQEQITDSLETESTNNDFFNVSGSIGLNRKLGKRGELRANFGKSFRIPYPNETSSNGVHHGTFRHEVGNPDLKSEHGYQLDLSTDWNWNKVSLNVAGYFNLFQNYIYLSPSSRFSTLPEAGQLFEYKQHDVIYTGGELNWSYRPWKFLELSQAYEYVWNYNLETGLPLPFTPPGSILSEIQFRADKLWVFESPYFFVNDHYVFAQNRVDRNEPQTPDYNLLNVGLGFDVKIKLTKKTDARVQIRFSVQNITNQRYLNHLSRYRWINVPEQGRNFVITVKVPLSIKLKKA